MVDHCFERIKAWNSTRLPFDEPGLNECLDIVQEKSTSPTDSSSDDSSPPPRRRNLTFSTDSKKHICEADLILLAVDTPAGRSKSRNGTAPHLGNFYAAVHKVLENVQHDFVLVIRSTVPCGTASNVKKQFDYCLPQGIKCEVLSNPEFMAAGTAVQDLLEADRVVIGSNWSSDGLVAANKLITLYSNWISKEKIITMSTQSAELAKVAANTILAQRISTINALSAISEDVGADILDVSRACGMDNRIGDHIMRPSPGFGGSCLRKDVLNLVSTAAEHRLPKVAKYFSSIVDVNHFQTARFIDRITQLLPVVDKPITIAVLGFAFKEDTSDTRESPAITVVATLASKRYHVRVFDPIAPAKQIHQDLMSATGNCSSTLEPFIRICDNVYEACDGSHAIVVLNVWEALRHDLSDQVSSARYGMEEEATRETEAHPPSQELTCLSMLRSRFCSEKQHEDGIHWNVIASSMHAPKLIIDGHNVLDESLEAYGFDIHGIGRRKK